MRKHTFVAYGTPVGKARARAGFRGSKIIMYDPATDKSWKSTVRAEAMRSWDLHPFKGPIRVNITAVFPRPKDHYRGGKIGNGIRPEAPYWHTNKPDRDNIDKAILDALTEAGLWKDDCQVCEGTTRKRYVTVTDGWMPHALVEIEEI